MAALVMAGCDASDDSNPTTDSGTDLGDDSAIQQDAPLDTELNAPLNTELDAPLDTALNSPPDSPPDSSDPATEFTIRKPGKTKVTCSERPPEDGSEREFPQVDHVCTYKHGGKESLIYIQGSTSGAGMPARWLSKSSTRQP